MKKTYKLEGKSCGGCSSSVEQAIKASVPEAVVMVELDDGLVLVEGVDDDAMIKAAVESAGFTYSGPV
jgi:copper chaperone